jgi:1-acyl-sn-glycerol-3-phosphate acyltransferase
MRGILQRLIEALFRVLFTYDCVGEASIPVQGPAVVAANHPSYLDPLLLSLQVARPIHFMAWDALFRVPLLGALMRLFGAIPVDVRPGRGRDAYTRAKALLAQGEVVGIFPEGRRSRSGWMEPALREGAARLALETGAPLVPATIVGAFRAWPHFRVLPRLARIKVRFHEAIDPAAFRGRDAEQGTEELLLELRRRVDRALLPGVKADLRISVLYRTPAPWPRMHETLPALGLGLVVFARTRSLVSVLPAYAYVLYLLADRFLLPQSRLVKWIRNGSPLLFLLGYGGVALRVLGCPAVAAPRALAAVVLGGALPYLYERSRVAIGFVQGWVAAALLELAAQRLAPGPLGAHTALPIYAAAFAWERQSVFWRYCAPALAAYAVLVPLWLGGSERLLPHATAGLVGWLVSRLFPYRAPAPEPEPAPMGLGLQ